MKKIFDYIVITVGDDYQEKFLQEKLDKRREVISEQTECKIIIEKKKIGSGGALLKIINEMETDNKKILLINSAGKSTRMPLYADKGKICMPTFSDRNSIMLDDILEEVLPIGEKMDSGILVVSGDCTTIYKKNLTKSIKNNTAFSVLADAKIGERHGVFVVGDGVLKQSLQKENIKILKEKNAISVDNKVNIDTGIIYFNQDMINTLKCLKYNNTMLNLYTDLIYPLCLKSELEEYSYQKSDVEVTQELLQVRQEIWDLIKNKTIDIKFLEDGKFVHYGTTKEFLNIAFNKNNSENVIINSNIVGKITSKNYIENSDILDNAKIGKNSVIMDSIVNCDVPENVILKTIKCSKKFFTILYGNEKNTYNSNFEIYVLDNDREKASKKAIEFYNNIRN